MKKRFQEGSPTDLEQHEESAGVLNKFMLGSDSITCSVKTPFMAWHLQECALPLSSISQHGAITHEDALNL